MSFDEPDLPAEFAEEPPIELVPVEAVEVPPRRPRVWTVFVVFLLVLGAGLVVVPVFILLALVLLQYGAAIRSAADLENAIMAVAGSRAVFLAMTAGTLAVAGIAVPWRRSFLPFPGAIGCGFGRWGSRPRHWWPASAACRPSAWRSMR